MAKSEDTRGLRLVRTNLMPLVPCCFFVYKIPAEFRVSHSILEVGIHKIMLAEETMVPNSEYNVGNNISLCIQSADKKEIEKIYNSLIQDPRTEVITSLGKIVFSEAYGIVKDPFGVLIQLNYDKRLAK